MTTPIVLETAPFPTIPLTADEEQYYYDIQRQVILTDKDYDSFIDLIVKGINYDYSERVPDEFLDNAYKFLLWKDYENNEQQVIDNWVRISCNTSRELRRIYIFWTVVCNKEFTKDIRCFIVMSAITALCRRWRNDRQRLSCLLLWRLTGNEDDDLSIIYKMRTTVNENFLVADILNFKFNY